MRYFIALIALTFFSAPESALAQDYMVNASDPASVVKALQDKGYRAELSTDNDGDPLIISAAGGSDFSVYFYNCTKNRNCRSVQFFSGYRNPAKSSLELINEWNANYRFSKAILAENGGVSLQTDVMLDVGGVSYALFAERLNSFVESKAVFEQFIGWRA